MNSSILVRGGRIVDTTQGIDYACDIKISGGVVEDIGEHLPVMGSDKVIDAEGKLVVPGLVDIHTHAAEQITPGLGMNADFNCLGKGSTTVVDAGSTGELTFPAFKKYVIEQSNVDIMAFLNIESLGMIEYPPERTGQDWPALIYGEGEKYSSYFTNENRTLDCIPDHSEVIAGIKWAHRGPESLRKAAGFAQRNRVTLMVENHHMPESLRFLKKGDVITHAFHNYYNGHAGRIDGILDGDSNIHEEFFSLARKGIHLDLGHGSGSFSWSVADKALSEGLKIDTISTDLWSKNTGGPVFDLPTTMSKMKLLGLEIADIVRAVTDTPAKILGRSGKIGTLRPGAKGDLAVFSVDTDERTLYDSYSVPKVSRWNLVPATVIKGGSLVRI